MNSIKTLSFTTLSLLAALTPANAYFRGAFRIDKTYRQTDTKAPTFRRGSARLYLVDGSYTLTGCSLNGETYKFPVATLLGCNIGANAVVTDGLYNSPFSTLDREFIELVGLEEATSVEPGRPDLVRLIARPPSTFPVASTTKQISGLTGNLTSIFYNLQAITGDLREYRLAGYATSGIDPDTDFNFVPGYYYPRYYTSRSTMEKEIVNGTYEFSFPLIGHATGTPVMRVLPFPVIPTVEGYVTDPIKQGFRFKSLPVNVGGFFEYDARVVNTFAWDGLSDGQVNAGDRLYAAFRGLVTPGDVTSEPEGTIFPPESDDPITGQIIEYKILLDSPVLGSYTLPPGFYTVYDGVSDSVPPENEYSLLEITLKRDPEDGLAAVSTRIFQLPLHMVDTFAGAMAVAFPANTPTSQMAKNADPDGDGISNWVEWLSGTNPNKANVPKTLSAMSFVSQSASAGAGGGGGEEGYWQMELERPAKLTTKASVIVESSLDLTNWSQVDDASGWTVIDDRTQPKIKVISKSAQLTEKRYFRVRFNYTE